MELNFYLSITDIVLNIWTRSCVAEESILPKPCLELTSSSKPKRWDKLPPESILFDRLIGYFSMALINFSTAGPDFDKLINVEKLYISHEQQMTHDTNIWKSMASSIYHTIYMWGLFYDVFKTVLLVLFLSTVKKYIHVSLIPSFEEGVAIKVLILLTRTWKNHMILKLENNIHLVRSTWKFMHKKDKTYYHFVTTKFLNI